jgi:hypothetical protein
LIDSSSFIFKQHTGKYLHGGGAWIDLTGFSLFGISFSQYWLNRLKTSITTVDNVFCNLK